MRVIDRKDLTLPKRNDEEFRKVDFSKLFSTEFKDIETYEFDIMGLEIVEDNSTYDSVLFDITRSFDNKQVVLTINSNIPEPICLIHKIKEDDTFYVNSLKIEVKEDVTASVIEVFTNTSNNSAYSVNRSFELDENSTLNYTKLQHFEDDNSLIYNANFDQRNSSKCNFTSFELGNAFVVNNYINKIDSKDVSFNLDSLVKLKDESNTSNLVKTTHNDESSTSNINFKHTLKDSARVVFKAKSIVNEKALYSKAFQNSNTILLSNDATIFAQPHLEINIDELEASHGATTGTLDKDQLLYLKSRGISEEKAYDILLKAFESQIYDNIQDNLIKEFISSYKRSRYV